MPIHYFTRRTLLQDAPLGGIFSAYSPLFRVFACKARHAVSPRHAWGSNKDRCKIPSHIVFARTRTDDGELPLDLCLRTRIRCDKSDFLAPFYDTRHKLCSLCCRGKLAAAAAHLVGLVDIAIGIGARVIGFGSYLTLFLLTARARGAWCTQEAYRTLVLLLFWVRLYSELTYLSHINVDSEQAVPQAPGATN